ncbi:MAG: hypothetical protein KKE23_00735 [Nanoarchaeota archaeon]|nr:hypothetical protein [Nanoarchaeota archaeon]
MIWKKEELEYLKENYPKNIPLIEISEKISKTLRAIQHKAAREGISRPRFPSNNPSEKTPRKIIDERYYQRNKDKVYKRKVSRRWNLKKEVVGILGGKCQKCGYHKCIAALDLHHKTKNKDSSITLLINNSSRQKVLKEAEKCLLLCANCHRELHYGDHS